MRRSSPPATGLFVLALLACTGAAARAADFWVDGKNGQDVPGAGAQAQPWKTIGYALSRMTSPVHPDMHLIHVMGGQVYDQESFPLVLPFNVRLQGDFVGSTPPVLRGPAAASALVLFDPQTIYNRKQSGLEYLVLEGGRRGAAMGGKEGYRHRPEIYHCAFSGQAEAGVLIDQKGTAICDPRLFDCDFSGPARGIHALASGDNAILRPDIEECRFAGAGAVGYWLEDTSTAGSDVGGLVRYCWFQGCLTGVLVYTGANAMNTRIDIVNSFFRNCREDGIHIVVNLPADPAVLVEGCTFLGGRTGLRFQGVFTPGLYTCQTRGCVAAGQSEDGFLYDIDRSLGTGDVDLRIVSEGNLATACGETGFHLKLWQPEIRLNFDSLGDRALGCGGGFYVYERPLASRASLRIECAILAGNRKAGLGILSNALIEARFLTLADNGDHGLNLARVDTARFSADHCLLANNLPAEFFGPSGTPITYSAFMNQAYPGSGNIQGNPGLVRPFYKLGPASPCVDAGDGAARVPARDYEGDPRVVRTKPGGLVRPDIGADEYVPTGSIHPYGTAGFGYASFHPRIASPNLAVQAGGTLRLDLLEALDYASYTASLGLLLLGTAEQGPLFDLAPLGAPGSLLWQDLALAAAAVPVSAAGTASAQFSIPGGPTLIGWTFTAQWLAVKPFTNAAGLAATGALRFTIGQ